MTLETLLLNSVDWGVACTLGAGACDTSVEVFKRAFDVECVRIGAATDDASKRLVAFASALSIFKQGTQEATGTSYTPPDWPETIIGKEAVDMVLRAEDCTRLERILDDDSGPAPAMLALFERALPK